VLQRTPACSWQRLACGTAFRCVLGLLVAHHSTAQHTENTNRQESPCPRLWSFMLLTCALLPLIVSCRPVPCCAVPCCAVQFALEKLRGEHDAVNVCIAGTVSAGFLGATCEWGRGLN
jgi:hypothetical protein